jgi:hypothetical protein
MGRTKSDSKQPINPKENEFRSMKTCIATLGKLDKLPRDRVLKYLTDYFEEDNHKPIDDNDVDELTDEF